MDSPNVTYAPYNFIPFAKTPLRRYESPNDLPPHGIWDRELLSGEIRLTVTARTPVYIGNGKKEQDGEPADAPKEDFFRGADGSYAIPGSSLRGLVRENMQILGFGLLRPDEDFQDYRLLYRRIADAKGTLGKELRDIYSKALKKVEDGKEVKNVSPGILSFDGETYRITALDRFFTLKRERSPAKEWLEELTKAKSTSKPWEPWAFSEKVWFSSTDGKTVDGLSSEECEGYQRAYIMSPGPINKGKKNSLNNLYLFPLPDDSAQAPDGFVLKDEEIISYKEDYKFRENQLRGLKTAENHEAFWALPEEGEEKPVFYSEIGGQIAFGMTKSPRIPYLHSILEGLPKSYRDAIEETLFIDYPYAILGYAGQNAAYSSRVSFGDLKVNQKTAQPDSFYLTLAEPKISFFPGYVQEGKHYNTDGFQFSGYKQYWLKKEERTEAVQSNFTSEMHPLPIETSFSGAICYRNMHPDELGLLLWCLVLEKGCFQNIGRGKPYGYGLVEIKIDSLLELRPQELYGPGRTTVALMAQSEPEKLEQRIQSLIKDYKNALRNGPEKICADDHPLVRDFLYMKQIQVQPKNVSYMDLKAFRKVSSPLPTVEQYRNYPEVGSIVEGTVDHIAEKGFFVRLPSGWRGFVHISEIDYAFVNPGTIDNYVKIGQTVKVRVLPPRDGKLSFSYKRANQMS